MALDPVFAALLAMPESQLDAPPPGVTPAMLREFARSLRPPDPPLPVESTRDLEIPGPGGALRLRLYYPLGERPLPLVLFMHGGGWVLCDLDSHDFLCRDLALASGCAIASIDYRLAPETPFPGPLEDCYAALVHLAAHGSEHGLDVRRIALCGDSAGANLAAAVAIAARDRRGPVVRHQVLLCPALDPRCDSASMREYATGYMLSRALMQWFWGCYAPRPGEAADPLVAPLCATDLSGLPSASVSTAEFDPLRDEGEAYADQLRAAGVEVTARRYPGMIHDFVVMAHLTPLARRSIADVGADLRAALLSD